MAGSVFDQAGARIASALSWAWRETAGLLPAAIGQAGSRRRATLTTLDESGAPGVSGGAVQSWLGRWRHDRTAGANGYICLLAPQRVLRRRMRLSPVAAGDPAEAARLQAASLTPLRTDLCIVAMEPVGPLAGGGAEVEIAMARRSDIAAAAEHAASKAATWRVAADFDAAGPRFVFAAGAPVRMAHPLLLAALAVLAVVAALTAYDARLARDVAALTEIRDARLADVRAARPRSSAGGAGERAQGYTDLAAFLATLSAAPPAAPLARVQVVQGRMILEGEQGIEERTIAPRPGPAP